MAPRLFVGNSESVQDRVGERALDIGFIEGDSHLPTLASESLCEDELQVVCAPGHPLATEPEPLAPETIARHRAIAVADSARSLPRRSAGLLPGQPVMTVPTFAFKVSAQVAGLGVG